MDGSLKEARIAAAIQAGVRPMVMRKWKWVVGGALATLAGCSDPIQERKLKLFESAQEGFRLVTTRVDQKGEQRELTAAEIIPAAIVSQRSRVADSEEQRRGERILIKARYTELHKTIIEMDRAVDAAVKPLLKNDAAQEKLGNLILQGAIRQGRAPEVERHMEKIARGPIEYIGVVSYFFKDVALDQSTSTFHVLIERSFSQSFPEDWQHLQTRIVFTDAQNHKGWTWP